MKVNREDKNYDGIKAFLIARVSDPSQREALPAQEIRLRQYSEKYGLASKMYSFDETAYKNDRQKFQEIVDEISKYPRFCVVVFDKIDRFTRDSSSDVVRILKNLVKEGKIELHFPSDNLFIHKDSPAADKTRLGMGMVFGEYYSAAISDNVKRKIEQKLHDGEWPGKACVGYANVKHLIDGKEVKSIVPDPQRKDYIIKAYELRLEGKSFRTISKILKDDGFRSNTVQKSIVGQNQIESLLKNPFYYGVMRYDGSLYSHKYEPIISKHTFDTVQLVNDDRTWDKNKTDTKQTFVFSGILKCANCGCSISSYKQKGRVYMRCTKAKNIACDQPHTSEEELLPQIIELLDKISIPNDDIYKVIHILKSEHDNIQMFYRNAITQTRTEYNRLQKKLDVLYEDRLDGRITVDEYDKYVTKIKAEMDELDRKLVEFTNDDKSFEVTSEYLLRLASKAKQIFKSSQPATKNKILRMLLANATLNKKRLQLNLLKPFPAFVTNADSQNWLRRLDSNQ